MNYTGRLEMPQDLIINSIHYCPYCGKEMKSHEYWDHYDMEIWFDCDCELYKKASEIINNINTLARNFPSAKYEIVNIPEIQEKRNY